MRGIEIIPNRNGVRTARVTLNRGAGPGFMEVVAPQSPTAYVWIGDDTNGVFGICNVNDLRRLIEVHERELADAREYRKRTRVKQQEPKPEEES